MSRFHELLDLYKHTVSVSIHLPLIPERNDKKGDTFFSLSPQRILSRIYSHVDLLFAAENFVKNIFPC